MALLGIATETPRIILAELPPDDQDRIFEYLVDNKVDFKAVAGNEEFYATIKLPKGSVGFRGSAEPRIPVREHVSKVDGGFRIRDIRSDTGNRAVASRGGKSKELQKNPQMGSLEAELELLHAEAESGPAAHIYKGLQQKYPQFCKLLAPQGHRPKVMPIPLLFKFIDEVYENRYRADSIMLQKEKRHSDRSVFLNRTDSEKAQKIVEGHAISFPRYVYDVMRNRKGVPALVQPTLWSLVFTVDAFRGQDPCVAVFGNFLDETYEHLTLLLYVHARKLSQRLLYDSLRNNPEAHHRLRHANQKVWGSRLDEIYCQHLVKAVFDAKQDIRDELLDKISIRLAQACDTPPSTPRQTTPRQTPGNRSHAAVSGASVTSTEKRTSLLIDDLLELIAREFHESQPKPRTDSELTDDVMSLYAATDPVAEETQDGPEVPEENEELERTASELTKRIVKQLQVVNTDCTPEQVQPWAKSIAKRRISVGYQLREEAAEQAKQVETKYTTSVHEIKHCLKDMSATADSSAEDALSNMPPRSLSAFLQGTESLRPPTPADFKIDLEGSVHIILVVAVSEMVDQILESSGIHAEASPMLFMKLVDEFQSIADSLLEVLVNENLKTWLQILGLPLEGSDDTRGRFQEMYMELQRVLAIDINANSVAHICRVILSMSEFRDLLVTRIRRLATSSSSGTLVSAAGSQIGSGLPEEVEGTADEDDEAEMPQALVLKELQTAAQEAAKQVLLSGEACDWRHAVTTLRELRKSKYNKNHPFYSMIEEHMDEPEIQAHIEGLFSELTQGEQLLSASNLHVMAENLHFKVTNLTTDVLSEVAPNSARYAWMASAVEQPLTCSAFVAIFVLFLLVSLQSLIITTRGDGSTQAAKGEGCDHYKVDYYVELRGHVAFRAILHVGNWDRIGSALFLDQNVKVKTFEKAL